MSDAALTDSTAPIGSGGEERENHIIEIGVMRISKLDPYGQDNANKLTFSSDLGVDTRQFDKNDISESLLSVVGDPDGTDVGSIVENDVFVILSVSLGYVIGDMTEQRHGVGKRRGVAIA